MKVRSQPRLARRGAIYYFRAKIPVDLTFDFGRKREILESLRTANRREAEELVRIKSVELDQRFAELRQKRNAAPRTTITEAEIARLIGKATATRMRADEEGRLLGMTDEDYARHADLEPFIDDWLAGHGYELAKDGEDYRRFAYQFAKVQARVNQNLRARDRGEPVDTPAMPAEEAHHRATTAATSRPSWSTGSSRRSHARKRSLKPSPSCAASAK
jgi:hypothetical protein